MRKMSLGNRNEKILSFKLEKFCSSTGAVLKYAQNLNYPLSYSFRNIDPPRHCANLLRAVLV